MRIFILNLLFLSFVFALSPKDTIIIAVENEPKLINPVFSEDHDAAISLIFSGLTRFDENMNLQADLAKEWSLSKDGLVYDFVLRDDVFWHDGEKFSAKDVEFTLKALKDPKLNAPTKVNFQDIKSVEVFDDTHIRIILSKPFPPFLDALSLGILPKHLLENENLNQSTFNQNPIGTGAFKFKSWKKGQAMFLEANENYHLAKVKSPKLILRHIPDPSVSALALKKGDVDVALVDFNFVKDFKNDKNFEVLIEKSADYRALMFNLDNEILKDQKVRSALNYLIKKDDLIQTLLHGYGSLAFHPLQNSWANPKDFMKFSYDPQKAHTLLEQAGWKKNSQGIYQKQGKELSFEMFAMSNDPLRVSLVKVLQSEFAKMGIKTKAIAKPAGSFDYSKVDSFLVGWGSPYDPDFHTYRVFGSFKNASDWNFGHYKNIKVDEALKSARNSLVQEKRKLEYAKFIQALYEDPPFLFLVYLEFPLVYQKDIKGIKASILGHHGVGFTWNAYEWSK